MSLSDVDLAPFLSDAPPVPHDVWIEADMCAVFDDVQMLQLQLPVDNSQLQKDTTTTVEYLQCGKLKTIQAISVFRALDAL